ncbi:hypothetical protein BD311DRAFT_756409 [Dichomitus squalens]|uniref:Uncharacterized protein n=1 Tax=Dichomitus squalens TaxID=114155 RepID=A0A4Q9MPG4_9APHY|nr:hypothetical protein BD311DRAFT_756409 [Dichomitus squalens]
MGAAGKDSVGKERSTILLRFGESSRVNDPASIHLDLSYTTPPHPTQERLVVERTNQHEAKLPVNAGTVTALNMKRISEHRAVICENNDRRDAHCVPLYAI